MLAVFVAVPLVAVFSQGLAGGLAAVLVDPVTWRVLGYTAAQAAASTLLALLAGLPAAYVVSRLAFPGRRALLVVLVVPFVLPTVVVGLAFRALVPGLTGTTAAVLLAHVFFNIGVVVRVVGGLWGHLDPRAGRVAATLGARPWQAFRAVTWPLLRPAVAAAAALVFVFTFTSFGVVLVVGDPAQPTLEVEIYRRAMQLFDLPGAAALGLLQLAAVAAALVVAARLQRRLGTVQPLSPDAMSRPRSRTDRALVALVAAEALLVLAPLAALAARSLRVGGGWGLEWYRSLWSPQGGTTRDVALADSLRVSVTYAVVATVLALLLGVSAACAIAYARRGGEALDTAVALPLGVSAVTLGLGLLLASVSGPVDLRGAWIAVPLGQALVATPLVVRTVLPVLRSVDPRLREVAATLGAGPWRAWSAVDGAQLSRAAAVAAGLACGVSLGEFGATAFLARADAPTVPVLLVRLLGRPGEANAGQAAALAMVLVLLTAGVVLATERWRAPGTGAL
jgi:thiamine transport system permease protein